MAASPLVVDVALLPCGATPARTAGRVAVVVDVLRFSTALLRAFESGAVSARPVTTAEEAVRLAAEGAVDLACGERGGLRPPGFHLGNSPLEYTPEAVSGRRLAFTTTNGTRALLACSSADAVLVGAIRNSPAIARVLAEAASPLVIVCAGTEGRFSLEDALGAGAILDELAGLRSLSPSDEARAALTLWREAQPDVARALADTDHARTLLSLGFAEDLDFAALQEPTAPVPRWDAASGLLTIPPRT